MPHSPAKSPSKAHPPIPLTTRFGVGFDNPSNRTQKELFADGTPTLAKPMREALRTEVCTLERTGRIRASPAAGDIRKFELSGLWMEFWNARVQADTDKAKGVLYEKRIFGLARQTAKGLDGIGVRFEMTSIANVVRDALRFKFDGIPKGTSDKRRGEMERASLVFEAIMAYDMHKVANLLEVPPKRPLTFGNAATRR